MAVTDRTGQGQLWQGFSDLADIRRLLDLIDIDALVEMLTGPPRVGRPPHERRPIVRAYLASYALGIPNTSALVRRLNNDPALRSVCGFVEVLPELSTFSRTFQTMAEHYSELVDQCCAKLSEQLVALLPGYGDDVAVDSTTVEAYANPYSNADPDASWTKKHSARAKGSAGEEWVYGYKIHTIADATHDLPISVMVTTASQNDSSMLRPLIEQAEAQHDWFKVGSESTVIADRGYDSRGNNEYVHHRGAAPVIHKRKPQGGLHDGIYTTDGVPTCIGRQEMEFVRTDPATGQHLYRCSASGCALRNKVSWSGHCDYQSWEDPAQDIRLFGGKIRRASWRWKHKYKKRLGIERLFSRWKYPGRLEQHCYMGLRKLKLHATMQMLVSLGQAVARHL